MIRIAHIALLVALACLLMGQTPIPVAIYDADTAGAAPSGSFDAPLTTDLVDAEGAGSTFSSNGPICQWESGGLVEYADNVARFSGEIPPGMTGGGNPGVGYGSMTSEMNSILFSRELDQWDDIGTPQTATASTDLFSDLRDTYSITDSNGGQVEGISQDLDVSALETSDDVQVCVYAKHASGTVLDLQVDESGPDSCAGGNTVDFAAATIDNTWTQYEWTHPLSSGDCTQATYKFSPTDWATSSSTSSAEFVVQMFIDQDWCPPFYCETTTAADDCGDDYLYYDATNLVDGSGELVLPTTVEFDFTAGDSWHSAVDKETMLRIEDTSSPATDYWYLRKSSASWLQLWAGSAESSDQFLGNWQGLTLTAGTTYAMKVQFGSTSATTKLWVDTVLKTNNSELQEITTPPDSLDVMIVGSSTGGVNQLNGWISNLTVDN